MFSINFFLFSLILCLWWFGAFLLFAGLGMLVRNIYKVRICSYRDWLDCCWLGWALIIFFLQIIHFFHQIDLWSLLFSLLIAGWGLFQYRHDILQRIHRWQRYDLVLLLMIIVIAFWMTVRATAPVGRTDTGLYHLAVVQWNATYPLVKGLGNLHGRFAFNNSFLLLAALFDIIPWKGQATHTTNTFLLLLLLQQSVICTIELVKPLFVSLKNANREPLGSHTNWELINAFYMLLFPLCLYEVFNGNVTSLTSDLPVTIVGVTLAGQVLRFVTQDHSLEIDKPIQELTQEAKFQVTLIILLLCLGITIKISFVVFGVALVSLAIFNAYRRHLFKVNLACFRLWLPLCCLVAAYFATWVARGIFLSGYPAYPLTIGGLPVPWQVPRSLVLSEAYWIQSWAKQPWVPWPEVIGNWNWVVPWVKEVPTEWQKLLLITTIALGIHLLLLTKRQKTQHAQKRLSLIFVVPSLLSLVYWFFSAPSFRFATASLWVLAAATLLIVIDTIAIVFKQNQHVIALLACSSVWLYIWPASVVWLLPINSTAILPILAEPAVVEKYTDSKLRVAVTLPGTYSCWNYPQPCTPYFRTNLHAFSSHDIRQGFYLDNKFTYADMQQTSLPPGITAPPDIGVQLVSNLLARPEGEQDQSVAAVQLLVYTKQVTTVALHFTSVLPTSMKDHSHPAQLLIHSSDTKVTIDLHPVSSYSRVAIPLQRDFTVLTIQPNAGLIQLLPQQGTNVGQEEDTVILSSIVIQHIN